VATEAGSAQMTATLLPLVRHAAAERLPVAAVMTPEHQPLLLRLIECEDPAVAVLAAEAWCRCVVHVRAGCCGLYVCQPPDGTT
jgi:hypothetical protein